MPGEIDLAVLIITYNEAGNIERCLRALTWVPEIVVVDSGSQDRTREIARRFTDRVIVEPFRGHIEQKNFALKQTEREWILAVDADEVVTPGLRSEIIESLRKKSPLYDGFTLPRRNLFLGRWMRSGGWEPQPRLRLARRQFAFWTGRNPHDRMVLKDSSRIAALHSDLLHYTSPTLEIHLRKMRAHSEIMAREAFRQGERATGRSLVLQPPAAFLRSFFLLRGFRDGYHGFLLAAFSFFYRLQVFTRLWELQGEESPEHPIS